MANATGADSFDQRLDSQRWLVEEVHMTGSGTFIESLDELGITLSTALERVRANRGDFVANASAVQMRQFERCVTQVRIFAEQVERELNHVEYLLAKRHS